MDPSVPAAIAEVIVAFPEATSVTGDGTVTWSHAGRPFAVLELSSVDICLGDAVATAAARTPDAAPSRRGAEWVRFAPAVLDDHAMDRLQAWLELAYRRGAQK